MSPRFTVSPGKLGLIAAALICVPFLPAMARAQPPVEASWTENIFLNADGLQRTAFGSDLGPEPQSISILAPTYAVHGGISFASPGPPNVTTTIEADVQSAPSSLGGTALGEIYFDFRVIEVSPPPVMPPGPSRPTTQRAGLLTRSTRAWRWTS